MLERAHLIQDHPQGPHVGFLSIRAVQADLGAQVVRGPDDRADETLAVLHMLRHPEIPWDMGHTTKGIEHGVCAQGAGYGSKSVEDKIEGVGHVAKCVT